MRRPWAARTPFSAAAQRPGPGLPTPYHPTSRPCSNLCPAPATALCLPAAAFDKATAACPAGFASINQDDVGAECLRVRPGLETAAAFLEVGWAGMRRQNGGRRRAPACSEACAATS